MNKLNQPDVEKLTSQELQNLIDEYCLTPQNIREILVVGQMFRNSTTIEEVTKEWEEKGFEIISRTRERFEVYKQWIHRNHYESAKVVIEKDLFFIIGQFPNEYRQLLIKTLKALGKEI